MTEINRSVTVTLSADDYAIANKLFVLDSCKKPIVLAVLVLLPIVCLLLLLAPFAGYRFEGLAGWPAMLRSRWRS